MVNFKFIYNHRGGLVENIFTYINKTPIRNLSLHEIIDITYGKEPKLKRT